MFLRHLLAILALPFVAAVIVPRLILARAHPYGAEETPWNLLISGSALALGSAGLVLCAWCIWLFGRKGRGTLAPWDPTRRLVVAGPYRHARNPMISGVLAILLAEAACFRSLPLALWAMSFWLVNHVYFVASEEPGLRRRFGADYDRYAANVPRWIPRRAPWTASD
jgi:protein-S-isoprenylcysteine O-methyltransferase Ste14